MVPNKGGCSPPDGSYLIFTKKEGTTCNATDQIFILDQDGVIYLCAFQVASPGLWNGLPNDIRNAKTMDVFKSLVKTHLFRKAYACYF